MLEICKHAVLRVGLALVCKCAEHAGVKFSFILIINTLLLCSCATPRSGLSVPVIIRRSNGVKVTDGQGFSTSRYSRPQLRPGIRRVCMHWPLGQNQVSSSYGRRWGRKHKGIDIRARRGTPVLAALGGRVIYAGSRVRGYGNLIVLKHARNLHTAYAHLRDLMVKPGELVQSGQLIAHSGATGRVTGPHLHFEVRDGSQSIDPYRLLVARFRKGNQASRCQ